MYGGRPSTGAIDTECDILAERKYNVRIIILHPEWEKWCSLIGERVRVVPVFVLTVDKNFSSAQTIRKWTPNETRCENTKFSIAGRRECIVVAWWPQVSFWRRTTSNSDATKAKGEARIRHHQRNISFQMELTYDIAQPRSGLHNHNKYVWQRSWIWFRLDAYIEFEELVTSAVVYSFTGSNIVFAFQVDRK